VSGRRRRDYAVVAILVGIGLAFVLLCAAEWYVGYRACRSKHPDAAPWACAVNP